MITVAKKRAKSKTRGARREERPVSEGIQRAARRTGIKRPTLLDTAVLTRFELRQLDRLLANVAAAINENADIKQARRLIGNAMRAAS